MEGNQPDNPQPDNPQPDNIIRRQIPFFPGLFLQIAPRDILQDSMNDETPDKPAKKDFINSLEEITVDQEMIDQKISCSICLDEFNINDKCIKLPCENPHYFHIGKNKDECEGVLPWFKLNHNCPVCRCEFPEEEKEVLEENNLEEEQEDEVLEEEQGNDSVNELMNRFNQLLREDSIENIIFPSFINRPRLINMNQMIDNAIDQEEDRQLQEAIRLSLGNN
jgi:hypothetical protein